MIARLIAANLCLLMLALPARAQLLDEKRDNADVVPHGKESVKLFRVGATISTPRGPVKNLRAFVAVPYSGEEQEVRIVKEDYSPSVRGVQFRDLPQGGARLMFIHIPSLGRGEKAHALVTYEVRTKTILPPKEDITKSLVVPDKPDREVRQFLTTSPYIESRDRRIRDLASELWEKPEEENENPTDWQRIESLYDGMLDKIQYVEGEDKSALNTLRDGQADCNGRSNLFVALCRANKVPARCVWVHNHCYAEFYLVDAEGKGAWHPAESAGTRAFGEMPLARTIMQKGDNFRNPWTKKDRLRYASDLTKGQMLPGGEPKVKFIREIVGEDESGDVPAAEAPNNLNAGP